MATVNMEALHLPPGLVLDESKPNPLQTNDVDKLCTTYAKIAVPVTCDKCGLADKLSKYGGQVKKYRDSPSDGYYRVIVVKAGQRFKCKRCNVTFRQQIDAFDPNPRRLMTSRCVRWIRDRCLIDTFKHVADHIGCVERVVRNITYEYMVELEKGHQRYLPEWLGIDETSLNGKKNNYVCVLVDAKQHIPIDVLPDREKKTVYDWLSSFGPSPQLHGVSMDMWRPYKQAVAEAFCEVPVPVVIDRFHVVNWANKGLTNVRRRLKGTQDKAQAKMWLQNDHLLQMRRGELYPEEKITLDSWLSSEPLLERAYHFKEEFCRIYELEKKSDAAVALDKWRKLVQKEMPQPFKQLLTLTDNWREEILAFFDFDGCLTNGYTEGFNSELKAQNRKGMGYTFDVLRARILYGSRIKRRHIKLAEHIELTRNKPNQEKPEVAPVTKGETAATATDAGDKREKAAALLAQSGWQATCPMCGVLGDIERLQHYFFFLPGVSITGDPLRDVYICSSCYDGLNQEQKESIAINNEMERAQWNTPAMLRARSTFHGKCDKCGTTDCMDRIQYHFDFLPGVSYKGAPLVNAIICVSCYENLLQEHPDILLVPATSRSEVSQETQTEFSPCKSEEPKDAFSVVQNGVTGASCTDRDPQGKVSGNVSPARKRPPSHPILARDLRRSYQGLPPGEPPLPRKPRKKRRRWKLDDASSSHSEPDKGNVLLRPDDEAPVPVLASASEQYFTEVEQVDNERSEIAAFAEPSGDSLKQLSFSFSD
jgi:transposase